jgi:hypothetical protein
MRATLLAVAIVLSGTAPAGEFADQTPSAGTISHSAAGHLAFLQSHVAREITCPVVPRGFFEPGTGRIQLSAAPATKGTK